MLKHPLVSRIYDREQQPPLGGCVLKPLIQKERPTPQAQPPLGGCVLKPMAAMLGRRFTPQPPLGGCVLKPDYMKFGAVREISRL